TMKAINPDYLTTMGIDSTNVYVGDALIERNSTPLALIGSGVAAKLDLNVYDQQRLLQLFMPKAKKIVLNPARAFTKKYIRPSGIYSIQKEFDDKYVLLPYSYGEKLTLKHNKATHIEVNMHLGANESQIKSRLQTLFGYDFSVKTRQEQHDFIHKILNSEKLAVYLILSFVLLIAAFNLVGTLTMLAIEKKKDMAVLSSMGLSKLAMVRVFSYHGLLMSGIGAAIGLFLGTMLCMLQMQFGFISIPGATFVANAYPVAFNGTDHLLVLLTVVVIGFLASWLPAKAIGGKIDLGELQSR
ncbi:MAG: ABC transporter permease, partial [Bacteroidetes bacterium]|nr:ABC transporter permease [Bacteroidota bacterium]